MPLTTLPDGTVQHTGPSSCGRIWRALDGMSAYQRALRCPDLNDEDLAPIVAGMASQQQQLAALAADYQSALSSSVQDRSALHQGQTALAQQIAALSAAQTALAQQVATLAAQRTTIKYKPVQAPAIVALLGGSVDVTIVWDTPFPDVNYIVYPPSAITQGLSLLGKVGQPVVKSKAADRIVVTVTTSAAVTAGAVEVHALAYRVGV